MHHRTGGKGDPNVGSNPFHIMDTVLRHSRHRQERISKLLFPHSPTPARTPDQLLHLQYSPEALNGTHLALEAIQVKRATKCTHELSCQWFTAFLAYPHLTAPLPSPVRTCSFTLSTGFRSI